MAKAYSLDLRERVIRFFERVCTRRGAALQGRRELCGQASGARGLTARGRVGFQ